VLIGAEGTNSISFMFVKNVNQLKLILVNVYCYTLVIFVASKVGPCVYLSTRLQPLFWILNIFCLTLHLVYMNSKFLTDFK
jgi:hypothetical protein